MTESLAELQVQYQDFLQGEVRCVSVRLWWWWWRRVLWCGGGDLEILGCPNEELLDVSGIVLDGCALHSGK